MARRTGPLYDSSHPQAGDANPAWRGGRTITEHGYVLVHAPNHPEADCRGYAYEHRLVAADNLGRALAATEEVHHRNENKADNRWENLLVTDRAHHAVHHRKRTDLRLPGEANPLILCECGCGSTFLRYDPSNRPRRFLSGHNTAERNRGRYG
jgi:hypothetical protein